MTHKAHTHTHWWWDVKTPCIDGGTWRQDNYYLLSFTITRCWTSRLEGLVSLLGVRGGKVMWIGTNSCQSVRFTTRRLCSKVLSESMAGSLFPKLRCRCDGRCGLRYGESVGVDSTSHGQWRSIMTKMTIMIDYDDDYDLQRWMW